MPATFAPASPAPPSHTIASHPESFDDSSIPLALVTCDPAPTTVLPSTGSALPTPTDRLEPGACPSLTIDLSGLEGIEVISPPAALGLTPGATLADVVACTDPPAILEHWPRDPKGRPATRTRVLLVPLGEAHRSRRQPCLMAESAWTLREMPAFTVRVSSELRYSFCHSWLRHPRLWLTEDAPLAGGPDQGAAGTAGPAVGADPALRARCRQLMRAGCLGQACEAAGVGIAPVLRRLLARCPQDPAEPTSPDDVDTARQVLSQLAPWKLAETVRFMHADLQVGRVSTLKVGGWSLGLFWFPGQTRARKRGIYLTQSPDGAPLLTCRLSADNGVVAAQWWKDLPGTD